MIVSVPALVTVQNKVMLSPGIVLIVGLDLLTFSITMSCPVVGENLTSMGTNDTLLVSSLSKTVPPASPSTNRYHLPSAVPVGMKNRRPIFP